MGARSLITTARINKEPSPDLARRIGPDVREERVKTGKLAAAVFMGQYHLYRCRCAQCARSSEPGRLISSHTRNCDTAPGKGHDRIELCGRSGPVVILGVVPAIGISRWVGHDRHPSQPYVTSRRHRANSSQRGRLCVGFPQHRLVESSDRGECRLTPETPTDQVPENPRS
jgi:hypothetical protein